MSDAAQLSLLSPSLFGGVTMEPERDGRRLRKQLVDVYEAMKDGQWRTLGRIHAMTGHPEASISSRIRDLKKPAFGGYAVESRYVRRGLWEYRVLPPKHQRD